MSTPHRTPDGDRPSPASCARFAVDLHHELASARLAWDAALLRSDAAVASGDATEVAAAIEDHRLLLTSLQDQVGSLLEDAAGDRAPTPAGTAEAAGAPEGPRDHRSPSAIRRGTASLLGAAAAAALVTGLTVGAMPRLDDGPRSLAAHGATDPVASTDAPALGEDVVAAADTVAPTGAPAVPRTIGPVPELAPFAVLPPDGTDTVDDTETASPGDAEGAEAAPSRGRATDRTRPDAVAETTGTPAVEPDPVTSDGDGTEGPAAGAALTGTLEELEDRLTDHPLGSSEVASRLTDPLAELPDRIRRVLEPDPTSEPGTGLR